MTNPTTKSKQGAKMEFKGLRPLFVVKPNTVSRKDIQRAERLAGICIIECGEPEACRFLEAPAGANLDEQARAALALMRVILSANKTDFSRGEMTKWFVEFLLNNKPPQQVESVRR